MPTFNLDDSLVLGIEPFDDHHKHLVKLLDETYDLLVTCGKHSGAEEVLDELIDYATHHFATEELWMTKLNYPKQEEHKTQHEEFSFRVVDFQRELIQEEAPVSMEGFSFLQNWLLDHIKKSDGEYGRFIHRGHI